MPIRVFQCAALMVAFAAAGCAQYPGMPSSTGLLGRPMSDAAGRPMALSSMPGLTVSGIVMAPASVISAGGANVISAGGANVVSAGGGNVISAGGANWGGSRAVLSLSDERPVSGASIYLADMTGQPLAGTAQAVSDGQGRYAFHQVPADTAYMVVATFRTPKGEATLRSLGVSGHGAGDQVVSVASTLVTLAVTQSGATHVTPEAFQAATEAVATNLRDDALPDLTQPAEVAAKAQAIASIVAPVRQVVDKTPPAPKDAPPASTGTPDASAPASTSSAGPNGASYTPVDAGVPAPSDDTGSGATDVPAAAETGSAGSDSTGTTSSSGVTPATNEPSTGQTAGETTPPTQGNGHGQGHAGNGNGNGQPSGQGATNGNGHSAGHGHGQANGNGPDKDKDKEKDKDKDKVPPGQDKKDQ